jgi:hypothetical protein
MATLLHLPPWAIDYSMTQENAVTRTKRKGFKRQSSYSHRKVSVVSVTRRLYGAQLPYFEHFVRTILVDGSLSFTDLYKDGSGVQSGTMRIIDGAYKVTTNGLNHVVSCTIEVFR